MKMVVKLMALLLVVSMLALPVAASGNFTPSVEQKGAPVVVPTPPAAGETGTETDESAGLLIFDDEDKLVATVPVIDVRVTPYADRDTADEVVKQELDNAFDSVAAEADLKGAVSALEKALEKTLEKMENEGVQISAGVTTENLIVRDIFNVGLNEEGKQLVNQGKTVAVTFDLKVTKDQIVIPMRYVNADDLTDEMLLVLEEKGWFANLWDTITGQKKTGMIWVPVDPDMVVINEDGSVTIRLAKVGEDIGTIAFVTQRIEE